MFLLFAVGFHIICANLVVVGSAVRCSSWQVV